MKAQEAESERSEDRGWEDQPRRGAGRVNRPLQTHTSPPRPSSHQAGRSLLGCPASLLLLSLLLLALGLPVLGAPPRLICDSRVLERYILEAREAENVTVRPLPRTGHRVHWRGSGASSQIQEPGLIPGPGFRPEVRSQNPSKIDKTGSPLCTPGI